MDTSRWWGPGAPWLKRSTVSVGKPGTRLKEPRASVVPSTFKVNGRPSAPSVASCWMRMWMAAGRSARANGASNQTESIHTLGTSLASTGSTCQATAESGGAMDNRSWLLFCRSEIQKARGVAPSARMNWSELRRTTASRLGAWEDCCTPAMRSRASVWVR